MHSCACRCSCLPQGPWVCVHCIRARMPCNACVRRRIHSTCMHIRRSCSRNHILSRTTPRGIPYDDAAWIPSPVGWGDLVDCGFLRRAAKDRRLLLHVLRARLELARLLPCRVGYHVVWDTIPCLTMPRGVPCHAGHRAMRVHAAWDTVSCEIPCLVACHAWWHATPNETRCRAGCLYFGYHTVRDTRHAM
jgi:hypothetical protein